MKKTINENIKQIKNITSKMPKTVNEAMDFENNEVFEGYEDEAPEQEMPVEPQPEESMPEEKPQQAPSQGDTLNVEEFVDDIRKKALRGMAQLADNPDDERYQLLKKIWQICDKKPEQQTAFSNPNQQMQKKF